MYRHFALAVFSVLLACAPPAVTSQATGEKLFAKWEVHMVVSGGIAGVSQTLIATSDGELIARDLKRGASVERRADEQTAQNIARALNTLKEEPPRAAPFPGRCRDCFNYEIQAVLDGERRYLRLSSERLEDSPYRELVRILAETLRRTLPG